MLCCVCGWKTMSDSDVFCSTPPLATPGRQDLLLPCFLELHLAGCGQCSRTSSFRLGQPLLVVMTNPFVTVENRLPLLAKGWWSSREGGSWFRAWHAWQGFEQSARSVESLEDYPADRSNRRGLAATGNGSVLRRFLSFVCHCTHFVPGGCWRRYECFFPGFAIVCWFNCWFSRDFFFSTVA